MNRPQSKNPWLVSFWRLPCLLGLVVLGLDHLTKYLVIRAWPEPGPMLRLQVIPGFFSLVHYRNRGAAWGIFSDHTFLLAVVSVVVFAMMVYHFRRLTEDMPERALALGAVLGGVVGNMLDRLFRHEVVDFLLFYWHGHAFPAFNVADSAITCGIGVFIVSSFLRGDPREEESTEPTPAADD
jgi:signal peptidase II